MKYLLSVLDDVASMEAHPEGSGTAEEAAAIDVLNDQLEAEGSWVFAAGLGAPSVATVVDSRGEQVILTDGPFADTKEGVAGFWVVDVDDLDAALGLATRASNACNRRVEVRPFLARP